MKAHSMGHTLNVILFLVTCILPQTCAHIWMQCYRRLTLQMLQDIFVVGYVKFAMPFNLRLTSRHWWIYSTHPGIIVFIIIKGLSHSTTRAKQTDNTALHLYQLGSCDALICPDWVWPPSPNAAHPLPRHLPTAWCGPLLSMLIWTLHPNAAHPNRLDAAPIYLSITPST